MVIELSGVYFKVENSNPEDKACTTFMLIWEVKKERTIENYFVLLTERDEIPVIRNTSTRSSHHWGMLA